MSNLQIKRIDDHLYERLKALAASENRSVSQQVLFLVRQHLAQRDRQPLEGSPGQVLLELAGSWQDERSAEEIAVAIKGARRLTKKQLRSSDESARYGHGHL